MTRSTTNPDFERTADPAEWSSSRLTLAGKCGLAFEYQYVRGLPAPQENARAIFGNAVHNGVQVWYELPDEGPAAGYQAQDLAPIVLAQWEKLLPPVVWKNVLELRDLDEECEAVAAAILFKRPTLKNPQQTKEYLEAEAVKTFMAKRAEMIEKCDALEEIKWPKVEDPYKAYVLSAKLAEQMQVRWQALPRPLAVEKPFRIEIEGFSVRGRMDQYRQDPARATGEVRNRLVDIKTGLQPMTQMEAFLQTFIYNEAIYQDESLPDTDDIAFYLARHDKYQQGRIDRARHRALASRILNGRARQITMGQFEPSYGMWCKTCDFRDLCENEISLWSGEGLVVELMD